MFLWPGAPVTTRNPRKSEKSTYPFIHDASTDGIRSDVADISEVFLLNKYDQHHADESYQANSFVLGLRVHAIQYRVSIKKMAYEEA